MIDKFNHKSLDDGFLIELLKFCVDQEIPGIEQYLEKLHMVEQRAKVSLQEHLGFGKKGDTVFKYLKG